MHFRSAAALALLSFSTLAPALHGQDDERSWTLESELGVSVFFGASKQSAVTLAADYGYEAEWLEFASFFGFDYGEAQATTGDQFVNKRAWAGGMTLDYQPQAGFSPFAAVNGEGSLSRQIDRRVSTGLGAKVRFLDSDRSKLDLSAAALLERTEPRTMAGEPDTIDTAGRWSSRLRASRNFDEERIRLGFTTFYKPAITDFSGDYTLDFDASLAFALNGSMSLKLSLVNKFDSLAKTRGARSNTDGRFFVSILAKH